MTAPALIANDMAAHALYWAKRDKRLERLCADSAALIRAMLARERIDGRRYHGVWRRLLDSERTYNSGFVRGFPNFGRARSCIENLKAGEHHDV